PAARGSFRTPETLCNIWKHCVKAPAWPRELFFFAGRWLRASFLRRIAIKKNSSIAFHSESCGQAMASLRKSGLSLFGDLPWGSHFCLFYETKQDLLDTVIPYLKAGLDMGEFCTWAVSGPLNEEEALSALRRATPCIDRHLAAGSIEIISGAAWYLEGDRFDP